MNCPSPLQISNAKSTVGSDPDNTTQCSFTIRNSSALCDRKQSASSTPAPNQLLQSHEQRLQVAILQVDRKNGRSQRETVLPQKRKEPSNLPCEKHERQNGRPSNKIVRLSSQSSKGQSQKSMGTSNKERLKLGSPKELPVEAKVDQMIGNKDMRIQKQKPVSIFPTNRPHHSLNINNPCVEKFPEKGKLGSPKELPVEVKLNQRVGNKDMRVHQQKPLPMSPTNRPRPSLNRNNPCVEKIPRKANSSHTRMKERYLASILDMENYGIAELEDSRTPTSCSESSRKAVCKPHEDKAAIELQPTTSKRLVSAAYTVSLNQKINLRGKKQKKADIQITQPCENRSSEGPGVTDGTSSQIGISPDIELCIGHPLYATEPDIEKILSEVILTTQRCCFVQLLYL